MSSLNAPMGHSGNPLTSLIDSSYYMQYDESISRPTMSYLTINLGFSGISVSSYQSVAPDSFFPILKLPEELLLKILNELVQIDCLSLMMSCSRLYSIGKKRLWNTIVIDQEYSELNNEMIEMSEKDNRGVVPTFIKTSFRIRALFDVIKEGLSGRQNFFVNHIKKEGYLSLIQKIHFLNVPQDFLSYELRGYISSGLFKQLPKLQDLEINTKLTSLEISSFSISTIKSLDLSLELCPGDLKKYTKPGLNESQYRNLLPLRNIESLCLSLNFDNGHTNSRILYYIMKSMLLNGDLSTMTHLELSNNSGLCNLDTILSNLLVNTQECATFDLNILTNFFSPLCQQKCVLSRLKKLCFLGFVVIPSQAEFIRKCVDIASLEELELSHISEFQPVDMRVSSETFTEHRESILAKIRPGFLTLLAQDGFSASKLILDYKECLRDSIVDALSKSTNLCSLNLTIRWNMRSSRENESLETYLNNLLGQMSRFPLLALSLDIKREVKPLFGGASNQELLTAESFLSHLSLFKKLRHLRIFCHSLEESFVLSLLSDRRVTLSLKSLDLFGLWAGGKPNMALEVAHAGIFDDWFKVQHIAIHLAQNNLPYLKFVRINGCLFEVKRWNREAVDVIPREGTWFDRYEA